ncbi:hypothetical protein SAMN04487981_10238 [Streptomyces sp. cf386]|uniref:hypothetical protein n=1 Tax=Streptomyces sp. cf386 TaxID=1761904 RepID=UPI00088CDC32|nr:hypothetical protein [Streptomyces sp. cf386]SDM62694.1 hypothetical protein SAMN04487981_10238 [Streptomyces sp. cf386]
MMGEAHQGQGAEGKRNLPEINPQLRATAAASAGGTLVIWWPAFTLGAYDAIFFDAVLAIWAVATSVLLSGVVLRSRGTMPWSGWIALSVPSMWILLSIVAPRAHGFRYLHYFEAVLTIAGAPMLTWMLARILVPDYSELPIAQRLGAVAVTIAIGITAFLLGRFNYLFLTCADFEASGNNAPIGCAHGQPFNRL